MKQYYATDYDLLNPVTKRMARKQELKEHICKDQKRQVHNFAGRIIQYGENNPHQQVGQIQCEMIQTVGPQL